MNIHAERYGKGEKVIFIHGAGGSARSWYFQKEYLKASMEVILIDLPGHGQDADGIDGGGRRIGADVSHLAHHIGREPCAGHEACREGCSYQADAKRGCAHIVERQWRGDAQHAGSGLKQHHSEDERRDVPVDGHGEDRRAILVIRPALAGFAATRV